MSIDVDLNAQIVGALERSGDEPWDEYDRNLAKNKNYRPESTFLNVDLEQFADSILADSIVRICQGVIGRLISEHGGVDKLLTSRMGLDNHRAELTKDFYEHKKFLKAEIMMELSDVIAEQIEDRLRPFSVADDLRERVRRFSLNGTSTDSDVAEDGE